VAQDLPVNPPKSPRSVGIIVRRIRIRRKSLQRFSILLRSRKRQPRSDMKKRDSLLVALRDFLLIQAKSRRLLHTTLFTPHHHLPATCCRHSTWPVIHNNTQSFPRRKDFAELTKHKMPPPHYKIDPYRTAIRTITTSHLHPLRFRVAVLQSGLPKTQRL